MFPIFYNFLGETQIDIALNGQDFDSFLRLVKLLVDQQNCIESSFLIEKWLLRAFKDGLDIIDLLNSNIISTKLDSSLVEHWASWNRFDTSTEPATINYKQPFQALLHDEQAYEVLFGDKFPRSNFNDRMHENYF